MSEDLNDCIDLFDNYITDENLDRLIGTIDNLKTFNILLDIKKRRISNGTGNKLNTPFPSILYHINDIHFGCLILKKTLDVHEENEHMLDFVNNLQYFDDNNLLDKFKMINVFIEFFNSKHSFLVNNTKLEKAIISAFQNSPKSVTDFLIVTLVPNYLKYNYSEDFIENIYKHVESTKNLKILCGLYCRLEKYLWNKDNFHILIANCLHNKDYTLHRQAVFLLHKVTEKEKNNKETAKSWKYFFLLLEISHEKELHLIQPSLQMISTIKNLDPLWQCCVLKILLTHCQSSVVYFVAIFIMQNQYHNNDRNIIDDLLIAINKNEYSSDSNEMYGEMKKFCFKMDNYNFNNFLKSSLQVSWCPTAFWCFCNSVFSGNTSKMCILVFEKFVTMLQHIPDVYIRKGCTQVISKNLLKNFTIATLDEFLKIAVYFHETDLGFLKIFIKQNLETLYIFKEEIVDYFPIGNNINCVKIQLQMLEKMSLKAYTFYDMNPSAFTDLIYLMFANDFDYNKVKDYIILRFETVQKQDIKYFLQLCSKFYGSITEKVFDIFLEDQSDVQQIVALSLIKDCHVNCPETIIRYLEKLLLEGDWGKDEYLIKLCFEVYCSFKMEFTQKIFENLSNFQSDVILISMYTYVYTYHHRYPSDYFNNFFEGTLNKLLNLCKCSLSKEAISVLVQIIYTYPFTDQLKNIVFSILYDLLEMSKCYSFIRSTLLKYISYPYLFNIPKNTIINWPYVVIELFLQSYCVRKSEIIQFRIYQEILSLDMAKPNQSESSNRLKLLDSIIYLICENICYADELSKLLREKYLVHFNKRYFPDSQLHLEKLRIIQAFIIITPYLNTEKIKIINLIIDSFTIENHQSSVKHLMQLLLIQLDQELDCNVSLITMISNIITSADYNRSSTVAAFIPVLYNLITRKEEKYWDETVKIFLSCTMRPQFKLRAFSQIALFKLYKKAIENKYSLFVNKYNFLYLSLEPVVVEMYSTMDYNINNEFLEYICIQEPSWNDIFFKMPLINKVIHTEWEDLLQLVKLDVLYVKLNIDDCRKYYTEMRNDSKVLNEREKNDIVHIQKKITPWRDLFFEEEKIENDFILITSLLEKASNMGGLSRTCEVFGVKQLVLKNSKITSEKAFESLSMSSQNWLEIIEVKVNDLREFIFQLKKQNYSVIGAEQTSESIKLQEFKFQKKTALMLGNEKEGILQDLIPLLDNCVEIPQFGVVRSLNVHVAGAIIIWEYCKQHLL